MFGEWLRRDTEASWDKLCGALQMVGEDKLVKHIATQHGICLTKYYAILERLIIILNWLFYRVTEC